MVSFEGISLLHAMVECQGRAKLIYCTYQVLKCPDIKRCKSQKVSEKIKLKFTIFKLRVYGLLPLPQKKNCV